MVGEEESRSVLVLFLLTSVYRLNILERFFSLLKDEQQLSVNDIELTSLGKAKSILPHKVKPKQRDVYQTYICM